MEPEEDEAPDYVRIPRAYWSMEFDLAETEPADQAPEPEPQEVTTSRSKRRRAVRRKQPAPVAEELPFAERHPLDFLIVEMDLARMRVETWFAGLWL